MQIIEADWPAPCGVCAYSTTRLGGVSRAPYQGLNLAQHTGDDPRDVARNRARLRETLGLPADPRWLQQVHGERVVDGAHAELGCQADAAYTTQKGIVCAVLTADCLPILLCCRHGAAVAAVHAGWRGLAAGIIERAVERLGGGQDQLLAWLGPAIGPQVYEVGGEVRERFLSDSAGADADAFHEARQGRWLADLPGLARRRLQRCGVVRVYGGHWCTYSDAERFFSYRRDGETGRMASLIWLDEVGEGGWPVAGRR